MSEARDFAQVVKVICTHDSRYAPEAYNFIRAALDATIKKIMETEQSCQRRHVSGQELSRGACNFALEAYGPIASSLLGHWGITRTRDFGELVYVLIEYELFSRTDEDRIEDFDEVFDLVADLEAPYLPPKRSGK